MKYILAVYWIVMVSLGRYSKWFRVRAHECMYIATWLNVEVPYNVFVV